MEQRRPSGAEERRGSSSSRSRSKSRGRPQRSSSSRRSIRSMSKHRDSRLDYAGYRSVRWRVQLGLLQETRASETTITTRKAQLAAMEAQNGSLVEFQRERFTSLAQKHFHACPHRQRWQDDKCKTSHAATHNSSSHTTGTQSAEQHDPQSTVALESALNLLDLPSESFTAANRSTTAPPTDDAPAFVDPLSAMVHEIDSKRAKEEQMDLEYRKERAARRRKQKEAALASGESSMALPEESPEMDETYTSKETLNLIDKDLNRLPSDHHLFFESSTEATHENALRAERAVPLMKILYIYAKEYPDLGYRQGMHEILSYLYLTLEVDLVHASNSPETAHENNDEDTSHSANHDNHDTQRAILDRRFLEHDVFIMFEKVMASLEAAYDVSGGASSETKKKHGLTPMEAMSSSILSKIQHVANDEMLFRHLSRMTVPPQLYCTRWVRLMFSREVDGCAHVLFLWDLFFDISRESHQGMDSSHVTSSESDGPCVTLMTVLEMTAASMIIMIRNQLLPPQYQGSTTPPMTRTQSYDPNDSINVLMNYPPLEDATRLSTLVEHMMERWQDMGSPSAAQLLGGGPKKSFSSSSSSSMRNLRTSSNSIASSSFSSSSRALNSHVSTQQRSPSEHYTNNNNNNNKSSSHLNTNKHSPTSIGGWIKQTATGSAGSSGSFDRSYVPSPSQQPNSGPMGDGGDIVYRNHGGGSSSNRTQSTGPGNRNNNSSSNRTQSTGAGNRNNNSRRHSQQQQQQQQQPLSIPRRASSSLASLGSSLKHVVDTIEYSVAKVSDNLGGGGGGTADFARSSQQRTAHHGGTGQSQQQQQYIYEQKQKQQQQQHLSISAVGQPQYGGITLNGANGMRTMTVPTPIAQEQLSSMLIQPQDNRREQNIPSQVPSPTSGSYQPERNGHTQTSQMQHPSMSTSHPTLKREPKDLSRFNDPSKSNVPSGEKPLMMATNTALKTPLREAPSSTPQSFNYLPSVQSKRNGVSMSKQNKPSSSGGKNDAVALDPFQDPLAYLAHEKEKKDLEEGNMQAITDYFYTMQQQKQVKADMPSKAGRSNSNLDALNGFHDFEYMLTDTPKKRQSASYLNPPSKN